MRIISIPKIVILNLGGIYICKRTCKKSFSGRNIMHIRNIICSQSKNKILKIHLVFLPQILVLIFATRFNTE